MVKQKAPIYQVEAIVGKKMLKGKPFYLVKWEGYDADQNTWEPYENLKECKEVVVEYENMLGKEQPLNSPKSAKRRRSKLAPPPPPPPPQPQPASSGRSSRRSDAAKPAPASPRPESPVVVEVVKVEPSPVKRVRTESPSSSSLSSPPPATVSKEDSPKPAKRLRSSREISTASAKSDRISPRKSTDDDEATQVLPSTSTCSSEAESGSDAGHRAVCLLSTFRDRRNRLLFVFELENGAYEVVDAQVARRQHRQTVMDFLMNEAT